MADILLVRHGETDWNREERFRGRTSVPLNAKGLWEADVTAQRIARQWNVTAVYSSPIKRARQTAEVIAAATTPPVRIIDDLQDIDYGAWQGMTRDEAAKRDSKTMNDYLTAPGRMRIPGGESFAAAQRRAVHALRIVGSRHSHETIVVVSHTDVNRLVLLAALGASVDSLWLVGQDTCAINVLHVDDVVSVLSLNDTCHLQALP